MSKGPFSLFLALLFTAGPTNLHAQQRVADATAPNPIVQQLINQVSKDSIFAHIRKLESFGTRYEFSPQRDSAATYIINKLTSWGYAVTSDEFSYSFADYAALDLVDHNSVWVIGQDTRDQQNLLLHTTDGGETWLFQPAPKASSLSAIDFVNSDTGWTVGSGGGIFKTTDGGASWQTQTSGTSTSLLDVGFVNVQLGVAVGYGGKLLRTTDGGSTWNQINTSDGSSLRKCKVLNAQKMWAVGNAGTILHSRDGGKTWLKQNSGVTSTLADVEFVDSLYGWVVGSMATVLKTTDGGQTWLTVSLPADVRRDADAKQADLCVLDPASIFIVSASEIWKTTDGGSTWKSMANLGSRDIIVLPGQSLLTYGGLAGIHKSTDGGASWQPWDQGIPRSLYGASRNCVATIQGGMSPGKEYVIVAHYDSPVGNDPGADNNASGVAAALEVMRVLKGHRFESTIRFVATSGEQVGLLGSRHYANVARAQGQNIALVVNLDMIGYPVTGDTNRIVVGSYMKQSPFLDSVLTYVSRYGIGLSIDAYIDSIGEGDSHAFGFAGYETLHFSEGTWKEILEGNPYVFKPTDTSDKLNPGMLRRSAQLMLSIAVESAKPVATPQKAWTWKIPYNRWYDLRALAIVDENTIVAVGDYGTIVKTTDGGRTWNQQTVGTTATLRGVWFTDSNRGVAVGDHGMILQTRNAGATWTVESIDARADFYGVCFNDVSTGAVVGNNGAFYQTTDGGVTWTPRVITPAITIYAVSFRDNNNGVFVGSSGTIYGTTDGGSKWSRQVSGIEGSDAVALLAVDFSDANNGVAVGENGTILRTTNGGANWSRQQLGSRTILRAVHFANAMNGFAVGDRGLIASTTDGGATWTEREKGLTSSFSAVRFVNSSTGFVSGSDGMLVRTTDGGTTWTHHAGGPRIPLYGVRFTGPTVAIAVGFEGGVYSTTDGGVSWEAQRSGTINHLRGVDFLGGGTGVAVGDSGAIVRTTDFGVTWADLTIRPSDTSTMMLSGVAFGTTTTGLIVGRLDTLVGTLVLTKSVILRTTDGGHDWVRVSVPMPNDRELRGVSFGGPSVATVVGATGLILRSTDSGVSWLPQRGVPDPQTGIIPPPTARLNAASFAGPSVGFVVGESGTLLRTLDGGATWTTQSTGTNANLTGVWTLNGVNALAVGTAGAVFVSNDIGATWFREATETTEDLYAAHFLDIERGMIVGNKGVVLRTALAGVPTTVQWSNQSSNPSDADLAQNYPNPFNAATTFEFRLAKPEIVSLKVFDILGREVATLMQEMKAPGTYRLWWDSGNLPSGVYLYRLCAGDFHAVKKMVLLR
jgi:photosystem II stability/assembly factor-like uncharacterized protein